eukprot:6208078-Pleurochrysis_carterae.AAC.2
MLNATLRMQWLVGSHDSRTWHAVWVRRRSHGCDSALVEPVRRLARVRVGLELKLQLADVSLTIGELLFDQNGHVAPSKHRRLPEAVLDQLAVEGLLDAAHARKQRAAIGVVEREARGVLDEPHVAGVLDGGLLDHALAALDPRVERGAHPRHRVAVAHGLAASVPLRPLDGHLLRVELARRREQALHDEQLRLGRLRQ